MNLSDAMPWREGGGRRHGNGRKGTHTHTSAILLLLPFRLRAVRRRGDYKNVRPIFIWPWWLSMFCESVSVKWPIFRIWVTFNGSLETRPYAQYWRGYLVSECAREHPCPTPKRKQQQQQKSLTDWRPFLWWWQTNCCWYRCCCSVKCGATDISVDFVASFLFW